MIAEDLVLRLPPSLDNLNGTYTMRTYPLVIYARQGWDRVSLQGVEIVPNVGICEVWVSDAPGVEPRRHATATGSTAVPQAAADPFRPLMLTFVNLNPDAYVDIVVRLAGFGSVSGLGSGYGYARFQGPYPFGTSGAAETPATLTNVSGQTVATAQGAAFTAYLTTDAAVTSRTIREITGQVRILSPSGTGTIETSGGGVMTIIVKQDGVVLEANANTLNLLSSMFSITNHPSQEINITGFAANAITSAAIAAGAISSDSQLGTGVVTAGKLADGAVDTTGRLANGIVTFGKLAAAAIGNGASQVAIGNHTHSTPGIVADSDAKGYTSTSVGTGLTTINSCSITLLNGVVYDVFAVAIMQGNSSSSGFLDSYVRIGASGTNVLGMRTGTVGGERPLAAFAKSQITGTGASVTVSARAQSTAGTGSVNDSLVFAVAVPRSVQVY